MSKPRSQTKSHTAGNVRIIGGHLKRRSVAFIGSEGLRPTPDRLRETLFNWLVADIHGARVLDSCAGSGVLGFEALSRGAAHCTFIETDRVQTQMLQHSAEQLGLDPATYNIIQGSAEHLLAEPTRLPTYSANSTNQQAFDLIFIDPPYAANLWQPILKALVRSKFITADTLIYLEADKDLSMDLTQLLDDLSISDTQLIDSNNSSKEIKGFECFKHTKVGQVFAGLYRLSTT